MKKIIVFGATGHLGAYTVDYLLKYLDHKKFEIVTVGRKQIDYYMQKGIEYIQVDVTKKDDFSKLPKENIHSVVCFVGLMPAAMESYDPYKFVDVNVTGILNVLEYARENKVNRIIFTQTEADLSGHWKENVVIYPDMQRKYPLDNNYAMYIITKCASVDMIESYYQKYGIKRFIFRLPTIYHYRPNPYFYKNGTKIKLGYRVLIERAMNSEPIEVWGDPNLMKEIVYVKDFTQMVYKAILADSDGGIYNVGNGRPISLIDQIKGIISVFSPKDFPSEIIYCPEKPNSRSFKMDITKAIEDLSYEPKYSYIDYLMDFKKEMELNRFVELWE